MGRVLCGLCVLVVASTGCSFDRGGDAAVEDDPAAADGGVATTEWWRADYGSRFPVIVAAQGARVPAGASVFVSVDTEALIESGKLQAGGLDWRVVHQGNGQFTELHRWIDDGEGGGWGSADTRTWFRVPAEIALAGTDSNTYIYFDNPTETEQPPSDMLEVFLFGDDFENGGALWDANGRGETVSIQGANPRAGQGSIQIGNHAQSLAGVHRDQDLPLAALEFSHYMRQSSVAGSFGNLRTFEIPFDQRAPSWLEDGIRAHSELTDGVRFLLLRLDPYSEGSFGSAPGTDWHRIVYVHDLVNNQHSGQMDDQPRSAMFDDYDASGAPIRSFALEGEGQGGAFQIDNYIIRLHVEPAPTVTHGGIEAVP